MLLVADRDPTMTQKGVVHRIMSNQTVDETKSVVVCPPQSAKNHTFTLKASANITGAVQIETATEPDYAGIWSPLGGGPIDLSVIGAAGELEFQFTNISIIAARARITTVIGGGDLTVDYHCN